jgi:hypothetical protein
MGCSYQASNLNNDFIPLEPTITFQLGPTHRFQLGPTHRLQLGPTPKIQIRPTFGLQLGLILLPDAPDRRCRDCPSAA